VNKVTAILLTLVCGWLATACLASPEPGASTAETTPDQAISEPTELSQPAATVTEAATVTKAATVTPGATIMSPTASAANADVEFVRAKEAADGTWTFEVTVRHPDTGWEDYADGWDVVTLQGVVLKRRPDDPFTRLLLHPHESEQPFTRNQAGLAIPEGVTQVIVRAHDIVDGFGGQEVTVDLAASSGPSFEVVRQ
jgi:hypothetical protein